MDTAGKVATSGLSAVVVLNMLANPVSGSRALMIGVHASDHKIAGGRRARLRIDATVDGLAPYYLQLDN